MDWSSVIRFRFWLSYDWYIIGLRHQTVSNSSIPPLSKESFPFLFLPKTKPETKGLTKKKLLANENQVNSFQKENKWMERF